MGTCKDCRIIDGCTLANKNSMPEHRVQNCPSFVQTKVKPRLRVTGAWASDYIQKLGIQVHCEQILEALEEQRVTRLYTVDKDKSKLLSESLDNSVMDLYVILDAWAKDKEVLYAERVEELMRRV